VRRILFLAGCAQPVTKVDAQLDQAVADTPDVQPDATIDAPLDQPAEAQVETAPDIPVERGDF